MIVTGYNTLLGGIIRPLIREWQERRKEFESYFERVLRLAKAAGLDISSLNLRSSMSEPPGTRATTDSPAGKRSQQSVNSPTKGEDDRNINIQVNLRNHLVLHHPDTGRNVHINDTLAAHSETFHGSICSDQRTAVSKQCKVFKTLKEDREVACLWTFDLTSLDVFMDDGSQVATFHVPQTIPKSRLSSQSDEHGSWSLVSHFPKSRAGGFFGFHCFQKLLETQDEDDLAASEASRDESGGDFDDLYFEDEPEYIVDSEEPNWRNHCLVLATQNYGPFWFPWKANTNTEVQILPALHPHEPIAVWSHSVLEYGAVDLSSGQRRDSILPEPVTIDFRSSHAVHKGESYNPS